MKYKLKRYTARAWKRAHFLGWHIRRFSRAVIRRKPRPEYGILAYLLRSGDREALARELRSGCQRFGYLLEPTAMYLDGKPLPFFPTAASLTEGWRYALDQERTALQLHLYEEMCLLLGRDDRTLRYWMRYLRSMGLRRVDEDVTRIAISPAARRWYSNTLGLEDGAVLAIDTHPWAFGDSLAAEGSLKRAPHKEEKP